MAIALAGAVALGWWLRPRTAAELYETRCSTCHALPDLSPYDAGQRAAIVELMRREKGADEVISAREAAVITEYLMKKATTE